MRTYIEFPRVLATDGDRDRDSDRDCDSDRATIDFERPRRAPDEFERRSNSFVDTGDEDMLALRVRIS